MAAPDTGLTELANRIFGLTAGATPYVAVGSDATAFDAAQTALLSELASGRVLASTLSVAGAVATIKAFFNTAQANGTVAETGLLSSSSGGVMLDRSLEAPAQAKAANKEMIVEYTVTLGRG